MRLDIIAGLTDDQEVVSMQRAPTALSAPSLIISHIGLTGQDLLSGHPDISVREK